MGKYVIKETATGVKFDLFATNGRVIATSEVYTTEQACRNGIASVQKNAPVAGVEDQTVEGFEVLKHPKFEIYKGGTYVGCLYKEFSFLTPRYNIDYNGWHIDGTMMEWDYSILDYSGYPIASISKELFHMTDTYVIDVNDPENALDALMFVLAIDAEKCSRN